MDVAIVIIGIIMIITGIIGSIVPVLPGPPLSFIALLLLQFREEPAFTWKFIVVWGGITLLVTLVDFLIPLLGAKKYGGTRSGIIGCFVGLVAGIFFAPIGLIVGPFIGALLGEIIGGKTIETALKPAIGSFVGFLFGTVLKLIAASVMAFYFFSNL